MGELLIMPLLTLRGYARSRKARGLPGGSPAAVKKAIDSGRIGRTPDGRIDADLADVAWRRNTVERCQVGGSHSTADPGIDHGERREGGPPPPPAEEATEVHRGAAGWLAHQICAAARREWPVFVQELWPDMSTPGRVRLVASLCERLEVWTLAARGMTGELPELDWTLFGSDAAAAAEEYELLRKAWPTVGRVDAGDVDVGRGVDFLQGAKSYARALVIAARRQFPRLIGQEVFEMGDDRFCVIHLTAVILALVEGWAGNYVNTEWLPPVDWTGVFSDDAANADKQYRALRQEWGA